MSTTKTIVIKLGTAVLTQSDGKIAVERLQNLLDNICLYPTREYRFIIVSSGAVGLGRYQLGLKPPLSLHQKQVCAAVGQSLLMNTYDALLKNRKSNCGQILVTSDDLSDRKKYLSLRTTLKNMLSMQVIPIINENDVLAAEELSELGSNKSFGDNDMLSALVASKLNADLLILLTDVDGIYDKNPKVNKDAKKISRIESLNDLLKIESSGQSENGRGGMSSKLKALKVAHLSGVSSIIASGFEKNVIKNILSNMSEESSSRPGTLFFSHGALNKKKLWIGLSSGHKGTITINDGAAKALLDKKASLLCVGVTEVSGQFQQGDIIQVVSSIGDEIGRGVSNLRSEELIKLKGLNLKSLPSQSRKATEVIHRDNLVIFNEIGY